MRAVTTYRFGTFVLDARRRRLVNDKRTIHLKPKEWDLLHYLVEHRECLVGKDELIDVLWPRQSVTEANLTQTMYRVRKALGDPARNARWIETVSRLGYRFIGKVKIVDQSDESSSLRSVAMVPFAESKEDEPPSDWSLGLTEVVIRVLSSDPELDVRPLSAVMHTETRPGADARDALQVDALIEGEISEQHDTIRVVANLVDGRSGKMLWSRAWVVEPGEADTAQARIAHDIHVQVGSSSSSGRREPVGIHFEAAEARTAYLRGRYCWHQFSEASLRRSIEEFDHALALSPRSAAARAWRSAAWAALGNVGALTPRESAERARRDADRAIAVDDRLAAGFEMRGAVELYFDWNLEAALRSFDLAIERDAESANAHHLRGNALAFSGNFNAALISLQRAELIDPTSLIAMTDIGLVHYLAGRFDEARDRLEAVLAQNEYFSHARLKLAFVLAALDQPESAVEHADRVEKETGNRLAERALFCGLAGRDGDARAVLLEMTDSSSESLVDPYSMALGYLGAQDRKSALEALALAVEFRSRELVLLGLDPVWEPLRSDATFKALTERVGLV